MIALINTDVFYEEWLGALLVELHCLTRMKVNKMKKKYEILLNRIKEYIIESGPVTSAQIHEWYIENYGTKQAPARNSIASTLRMYGKVIGVVGKRTSRSAVYTWEGEK
tara:strand:- start:128 stop:454 length:327 start_codon:yes stop_codon:yes gene_type:complete